MSKIDLVQLRAEVRAMRGHQALYKLLHEELGKLGYWQNRPRGNPRAGFRAGWGRKSD